MTEFMTSALAGVTYSQRWGWDRNLCFHFPSIDLPVAGVGDTVLFLKMFLSVASPYVSGSSSGSFQHLLAILSPSFPNLSQAPHHSEPWFLHL